MNRLRPILFALVVLILALLVRWYFASQAGAGAAGLFFEALEYVV